MVTRTGIESTERLFVTSGKLRISAKYSQIHSIVVLATFSVFKRFLAVIRGKQGAEFFQLEAFYDFQMSRNSLT